MPIVESLEAYLWERNIVSYSEFAEFVNFFKASRIIQFFDSSKSRCHNGKSTSIPCLKAKQIAKRI